jgi:hypothetical protein
MNKTIIATVGAVIVIGVIAVTYWFAGSANTQTATVTIPSTPQVAFSSTGQYATTTAPVAGVSSGGIKTLDFINDPTTVKDPINPGYYYLGYHVASGVSDPTATDNPPYIIAYISATKYFNIALLQEPIGPVRMEAEQYLMMRLGISHGQMCQLDYMVSVPVQVNSQYAGTNLGFSFCPGAIPLPK